MNLRSIRSLLLNAVFLSSAVVAMMGITPVWAGMLCGKSKVVESDQTVVAHLDKLPTGKNSTASADENTDHHATNAQSDAGSPIQ